MQQKLTLQAHAKLNLALDITGALPGGYHALDMVSHAVALCDTVTLERADAIELICPPGLPDGPKNIAYRAAQALREDAGYASGAKITLEKCIPMEAGLGGGSADAAAVLKGLNELWELHLTMDELRRIGLKLGADVPFALMGGTARVRGIGEHVEPILGVQPIWFVIAKPSGGVSTAAAYKLYDELGAEGRPQMELFVDALSRGDLDGMERCGGNALEKAAISLVPEIGLLIGRMRSAGAAYARMTGSGSAVFGVFASEKEALSASQELHDVFWTAVTYSASYATTPTSPRPE